MSEQFPPRAKITNRDLRYPEMTIWKEPEEYLSLQEHQAKISQLKERLRVAGGAITTAIGIMERIQREIAQCRTTFPHIPMSPSLEDYSIQPIREALAAIKEKK